MNLSAFRTTAALLAGTSLLAGCAQQAAVTTTIPDAKAAPVQLWSANKGEPQPVKILCWNLEHFVDPFDSPYIDNEFDNGPQVKSPETLATLAESIRLIDADIMAFQEVEGDGAIKLFLDNYLPGHEYKHFASVPSVEWHQNVAIASRLPLGPITSFREREMTSTVADRTRKDINARLMTVEVLGDNGTRFVLANMHLKAGRTPADADWRTLQAGIVHQWLERRSALEPGLPIVVVGDMNMMPTEPAFASLLDGAVPLTSPFAVWNFPPTHPADGPNRPIDHILLSQTMTPYYRIDSAAVAQPVPLDAMRRISDHLPVVATFDLPK